MNELGKIWVYGRPGSGKTALIRRLVTGLFDGVADPASVIVFNISVVGAHGHSMYAVIKSEITSIEDEFPRVQAKDVIVLLASKSCTIDDIPAEMRPRTIICATCKDLHSDLKPGGIRVSAKTGEDCEKLLEAIFNMLIRPPHSSTPSESVDLPSRYQASVEFDNGKFGFNLLRPKQIETETTSTSSKTIIRF